MDSEPVFLFADFSCPYSYVTEAMVRRRAVEVGAAMVYYAFELYPAPVPLPLPEAHGPELEQLAGVAGVGIGTPRIRPRTGKAHELARFARERGVEEEVREALYRAYWHDGRDIARVDVLTELAERHGLDRSEAKVVLDIDRYTDAVVLERELAVNAGITETPTVVVGTGDSAVFHIGAQPYAAWVAALPTA